MAGMIQLFIDKTNVHVQAKLMDTEYCNLKSSFCDAIARDSLISSALLAGQASLMANPSNPRPGRCYNRPPSHLVALLVSLRYDANGKRVDNDALKRCRPLRWAERRNPEDDQGQ